ncbi:Ribonuclease H domain [Sesbania bispinosa]|nr:Ribonuclease H domain [Sesbania bispinosa]
MKGKPNLLKSNFGRNRSVRWDPLPIGWLKLNTDGAFSSGRNMATCSGVVRDHWGSFLGDLVYKLGVCSIVEAKLQGIHKGLSFVKKYKNNCVIVEIDSLQALKLIREGCPLSHQYFSPVEEIKLEARHFRSIVWKHTLREGNNLADCFAKSGF